MNGSIIAVVGVGDSSMSDSLIGFQPRIDEPSKPKPSSNDVLLELVDRHGRVLPDAGQIDELEIDEFRAVLLCELEDVARTHAVLLLELDGVFAALAGADADHFVDRA